METAGQDCARRIEELVGRLGRIPDPEHREAARQLMEAVLELYGGGLRRMLDITLAVGETGEILLRRFAGDPLVAALLLLHELHPDELETRVHRALGRWHGSAELIGVFEGVVRVRLSGGGCGVKDAIASALREAAPDAVDFVLEESFQPAGFVPLAALGMGVTRAD